MQGIPQIGQGQQSGNVPVVQGTASVLLSLGEIVRGEVLNILPNAVSMRVKKEIVLAKTDIPLEQGNSYLLRVESLSENEVKLKVVQSLTEEAEGADSAITKGFEHLKGAALSHDQIIAFKSILEKMPESVWEHLPQLVAIKKLFKDIDTPSDETLKESLDDSGGYFETKLRAFVLRMIESGNVDGEKSEVDQIIKNDLKGNLLMLKEKLVAPEIHDLLKEGHVKTEALSEAVNKLITHIEQQQFNSKINTAFQTFIPFVWQGLKDGKLTFKESYRAQEAETEHACVIALDLEKAGRLVSQIRLVGDHLHLRFITENPKLTALLEKNKPLLEKQLSDIGLICNSLVVTQENTVDFENAISPFELDIKV